MDKKNILICVMIIITLMVLGVAFASNNMVKKNNINNTGNMTLNKTSNNTTVEHLNSKDTNNSQPNNNKEQSDSQMVQDIKNNPNMPDDMKQIYVARQRAAEDGVPMYEYTHSPELVEKYQSMG